mmetsp:Transcript_89010/g.247297  ORF Transcript_89010/g.247297 Transcript_89010/m.247297 type:complete len:267 (+) Transcript_89010:455-1255(+)
MQRAWQSSGLRARVPPRPGMSSGAYRTPGNRQLSGGALPGVVPPGGSPPVCSPRPPPGSELLLGGAWVTLDTSGTAGEEGGDAGTARRSSACGARRAGGCGPSIGSASLLELQAQTCIFQSWKQPLPSVICRWCPPVPKEHDPVPSSSAALLQVLLWRSQYALQVPSVSARMAQLPEPAQSDSSVEQSRPPRLAQSTLGDNTTGWAVGDSHASSGRASSVGDAEGPCALRATASKLNASHMMNAHVAATASVRRKCELALFWRGCR